MTLAVHGDQFATAGLLDFAVNVWPRPRPRFLKDALLEAMQDRGYPDEAPARQAIAEWHARRSEEVLLTNGACDAFWLLAQALRPSYAACVHPSFTEPERALRAAGADVTRVYREPREWQLDPAVVPAKAQVVVVGNPNNPTGGLDDHEALLSLLKPGRLVVVDESFMEFVGPRQHSLTGVRRDGLVVVRSLTKLWSLAGIRAGYLLGPPDLVTRLQDSRQPWSVNSLACAALKACAHDRERRGRVIEDVSRARSRVLERLAALPGVSAWPSAANFLLLRVPDGPALCAALRDRGIAVRPAASFPGLDERYIRVAVRPHADNDRLIAAMAEALP